MAGIERRELDEIRGALNKCHLGSREIFKELMRAYPTGIIRLMQYEMADLFNVHRNTIGTHLKDLRRHGLLRRGKEGFYIPHLVSVRRVK